MDLNKLFLEKNVGGYDLLIRSAVGSLAIIALAMDAVESPWNWVLAVIAFWGLFTGITRHCTPYALIGFSTKKK